MVHSKVFIWKGINKRTIDVWAKSRKPALPNQATLHLLSFSEQVQKKCCRCQWMSQGAKTSPGDQQLWASTMATVRITAKRKWTGTKNYLNPYSSQPPVSNWQWLPPGGTHSSHLSVICQGYGLDLKCPPKGSGTVLGDTGTFRRWGLNGGSRSMVEDPFR
jgi:hypothetical protein